MPKASENVPEVVKAAEPEPSLPKECGPKVFEERVNLDETYPRLRIEFGRQSQPNTYFVDGNGVNFTMPEDEEVADEDCDKKWFGIQFLSSRPVLKSKYKGRGEAAGRIDSWFYDTELKLFIVKRIDRCQYFKQGFNMFKTLPSFEVQALAKMKLN
jgi:hypothetical protein